MEHAWRDLGASRQGAIQGTYDCAVIEASCERAGAITISSEGVEGLLR
jgi:hypothetical protein